MGSASYSTLLAAASCYLLLSPFAAFHRSYYLETNSLLVASNVQLSETKRATSLLLPQRACLTSMQQVSDSLASYNSTGLLHLMLHSLFTALIHTPLLAAAVHNALRVLFPHILFPALFPVIAMLLDIGQGLLIALAAAYYPESIDHTQFGYIQTFNKFTWYAACASTVALVCGIVAFVTGIGRDGRQKAPAKKNV